MILFEIVDTLFTIYYFCLIGYILMSWIPALQQSVVGEFLEKICEPYLGIFRRFIPPLGMIDISPIVGIFVLNLIQRGVFTVLSYIVF